MDQNQVNKRIVIIRRVISNNAFTLIYEQFKHVLWRHYSINVLYEFYLSSERYLFTKIFN